MARRQISFTSSWLTVRRNKLTLTARPPQEEQTQQIPVASRNEISSRLQ
jgi:hypothetical protein